MFAFVRKHSENAMAKSIKSGDKWEINRLFFALSKVAAAAAALWNVMHGEDIKITQMKSNNNKDEINNSNGKWYDSIQSLTHKRMWSKRSITVANWNGSYSFPSSLDRFFVLLMRWEEKTRKIHQRKRRQRTNSITPKNGFRFSAHPVEIVSFEIIRIMMAMTMAMTMLAMITVNRTAAFVAYCNISSFFIQSILSVKQKRTTTLHCFVFHKKMRNKWYVNRFLLFFSFQCAKANKQSMINGKATETKCQTNNDGIAIE